MFIRSWLNILSYSLAISLVDALGQDNLDFYLTESDEIYSIVWLLDTFEKNMKVRLINVSSFTLGFWRETSAILFACLISPIQYTLDLITRTGVESGIFDNEAMNLYILLQLHKREHQRRINHGGGEGGWYRPWSPARGSGQGVLPLRNFNWRPKTWFHGISGTCVGAI